MNILAVNKAGTLYIKAKRAGMSWLCLMIDGVAITYFGKESTPYLTVDQAIAWHENELPHCADDTSAKCLAALREIKAKYAAGNVVINP